jgi:hypothetical protein
MRLVLLSSVLLLGACAQGGLSEPAAQVALDQPYFRCKVQPVLVAKCSFLACHGDPGRPYRLFARQQLRKGVAPKDRGIALTEAETQANYDATLAFALRGLGEREDPLLLSKPLDEDTGGLFHRGREMYRGPDVFSSRDDADYKTLASWMDGAKADPGCPDPGNLP